MLKRVLESTGKLLDEVRSLSKEVESIREHLRHIDVWKFDVEHYLKELKEMGKYKRKHCKLYNGKCKLWINSTSKENIAPTVVWCACCPYFKP